MYPLRRSYRCVADVWLPGCLAVRLLLASGLALDCSVHRGASYAEQLAELGGAVFAGVVQREEVRFLAGVQFGLAAA